MESDKRKNLPVVFRIFRVIIVLMLAVGIAVVLVKTKKKPERQDTAQTAPSVKVIKAVSETRNMTVEAFGTIKSRRQVKLSAEVPGRIDFLHISFVEGGQISKGEQLVRIDQRKYGFDRQAALVQIQQARTDIESLKQDMANLESDLALSKANVVLAEKELERIRKLKQNQFASQNVLDKAEQGMLQARITLQSIKNRIAVTRPMMEQRQAALSMAKVNFQKADLAHQKTKIVAPFDGWVLSKSLEVGEYVNIGQVIGVIYEKDHFDVDISISLEMMRWINPVIDRGETPRVIVSLAGGENLENVRWEAKLARLKANIDEKTRTLPMTVEIEPRKKENKPLFELKPGTFVKCIIQGVRREHIFVLPRYLLKDGDILFTADDNRLKFKKVHVFRKFEETIFIDEGLASGDQIISSPLPGAVEGMALTIKTNGK